MKKKRESSLDSHAMATSVRRNGKNGVRPEGAKRKLEENTVPFRDLSLS